MKKLSLTQGKLLIKLIDRECNQSSFHILKAFLGPFRANFYQVFAWTFGASLKKEYKPDDEDAMIERRFAHIRSRPQQKARHQPGHQPVAGRRQMVLF